MYYSNFIFNEVILNVLYCILIDLCGIKINNRIKGNLLSMIEIWYYGDCYSYCDNKIKDGYCVDY